MLEKRKPKTFLVNHKKTRRQQREFDQLSVSLRHLPETLSAVVITCSSCENVFSPDWFKKHEVPMAPIKTRFETKGIEYTGPKRWILHQVSQKCPKCEAAVTISLPVNDMRTKGSLFGDDAQRDYLNKKVHIYSLVGVDQKLLPEFEKRVKEVKRKLLPLIPPERWKIHMKDMWAGGNRNKHPYYQDLTSKDVNSFIGELLVLIKTSSLFIYNIAATSIQNNTTDRNVQKQSRDEAYILLVLNVIDEWTTQNAQPIIFFDSEKDSNANETIHGWARDIFNGNQFSLLYGFLSKGIEIPEPKFVSPASFPGLEIADFVSFILARYYFRMWEGKEIEIDPKDMGLVTYLGYDKNGDFLWKRQEGYPWNDFYH